MPKPKLAGMIESRYEFESPHIIQYDIRGHHDKQDFLEALVFEWGRGCKIEDVEHAYARNVPMGQSDPGLMVQCPAKGPGHGAYPITFVEWEYTWSEDDAKLEEEE